MRRGLSLPRLLLHLEGATLLLLAVLVFDRTHRSWLLFAVLLLSPDIGMVGYAAGSRIGAAVYNLFHTSVLPGSLAVFGILAESSPAIAIAAIWFAHIGMDRMLGYGLKYPSGFTDTHLGRL
jgi:Domain of unknown function (DUF4260)